MSGDLIRAKLKATGIHLGLSIVLFLGILYLILVEWYPGVFFEAEGGWSGIKLMAAVDLVLGPSLTFIIFNHLKSKKEIVFDLSLIAVVQIGALVWGAAQVYSERPVALAMWEGVFYVVNGDYYDRQGVSSKELKKYGDEVPLIIYAEEDHSVKQLKNIIKWNDKDIPPYAQVHLYQSVKKNVDKILSHQLSDEVVSTYIKQELTEKKYVFLGRAKHNKILVYLDSDANLKKITMTPKAIK